MTYLRRLPLYKLMFVFLCILSISWLSRVAVAASISPDGDCTLHNCVRYVLTTDDGLKLRVFEWKNSNGNLNIGAPAVVMINGFPHAQLEFLPIVKSALANHYRLITFDLRGHGLSDKPTTASAYANGRYAIDIANIIQTLNLGDVVLLAHSHGGTALMDYIINYQTINLKGIVLMGAFTKLDLTNPVVTTDVFSNLALQLAPRLLSDQDEGDFLKAGVEFAEASSNRQLPNVSKEILAMDMMVPASVRQAIFLPPRNVSNSALSNLPIRSLVIHGDIDELIKLSHARENHGLLGANSELIIYQGAGHLPQYEKTTQLIEDLGRFLDQVY